MSLRLEMLQVARLAPNLLADATALVQGFLEETLTEDGGGGDRDGQTDLYYTAFALDGLLALRTDLPRERTRAYLTAFGSGEELDLVHQACLARCWAILGEAPASPDFAPRLIEEVELYRSADGGFGPRPGAEHGTLYHAFLALGLYQDLGAALPETESLARSFDALRSADGGYANSLDLPIGTTPTTAAAVAVLRQLGEPVPPEVAAWLLAQQTPQGGFKAMPAAPFPDLLSTATALHALSVLGVTTPERREVTLDFIDSLWTGRAFTASWEDDDQDSEYVFYALLALGHLSLQS